MEELLNEYQSLKNKLTERFPTPEELSVSDFNKKLSDLKRIDSLLNPIDIFDLSIKLRKLSMSYYLDKYSKGCVEENKKEDTWIYDKTHICTCEHVVNKSGTIKYKVRECKNCKKIK